MQDDARVSAMDDYLNGLRPAQKAALGRVRAVVDGVVPGPGTPVPEDVLADLVQARKQEITASGR